MVVNCSNQGDQDIFENKSPPCDSHWRRRWIGKMHKSCQKRQIYLYKDTLNVLHSLQSFIQYKLKCIAHCGPHTHKHTPLIQTQNTFWKKIIEMSKSCQRGSQTDVEHLMTRFSKWVPACPVCVQISLIFPGWLLKRWWRWWPHDLLSRWHCRNNGKMIICNQNRTPVLRGHQLAQKRMMMIMIYAGNPDDRWWCWRWKLKQDASTSRPSDGPVRQVINQDGSCLMVVMVLLVVVMMIMMVITIISMKGS